MSADNFYIVRKHPKGGFAAVLGFASDLDEDDEQIIPEAKETNTQYPSVREAFSYAMGQYSEYGVSIHEECQDDF